MGAVWRMIRRGRGGGRPGADGVVVLRVMILIVRAEGEYVSLMLFGLKLKVPCATGTVSLSVGNSGLARPRTRISIRNI